MKETVQLCTDHPDCAVIRKGGVATHERFYSALQPPMNPVEATLTLAAEVKEEIAEAQEKLAAQRIEIRREMADAESETRRLVDPLRTTLEHLRVATAQETKSALARAEAKFVELAAARDELDRQPLVS